MAAPGLCYLVRSLIGWAGLPGEDPHDRRLALRHDAVNPLIAALDWLGSVSSG